MATTGGNVTVSRLLSSVADRSRDQIPPSRYIVSHIKEGQTTHLSLQSFKEGDVKLSFSDLGIVVPAGDEWSRTCLILQSCH